MLRGRIIVLRWGLDGAGLSALGPQKVWATVERSQTPFEGEIRREVRCPPEPHIWRSGNSEQVSEAGQRAAQAPWQAG